MIDGWLPTSIETAPGGPVRGKQLEATRLLTSALLDEEWDSTLERPNVSTHETWFHLVHRYTISLPIYGTRLRDDVAPIWLAASPLFYNPLVAASAYLLNYYYYYYYYHNSALPDSRLNQLRYYMAYSCSYCSSSDGSHHSGCPYR